MQSTTFKKALNRCCRLMPSKIHTDTFLKAAGQHLARKSNGNFGVTLIPGDGVGPELMESVQQVLQRVEAPLEFDTMHLSEVSQLLSQ